MEADRRQRRKEINIQQSESVWLQKALFALRKAEAAHEKLADARDEEPEPYTIELDGESVPVDTVQDALEERIDGIMKTIRERRRNLR